MSVIDIFALTDFGVTEPQPFLIPGLSPPYEPIFIALRARRSLHQLEGAR